MAAYEDLSGRRFGRLTVLCRAKDYVSPKGKRFAVFLCRCDCGVEVKVRRDHLINGNIVSCGCKRAEDAKARARELGKRRWAKRDAAAVKPEGTEDSLPTEQN